MDTRFMDYLSAQDVNVETISPKEYAAHRKAWEASLRGETDADRKPAVSHSVEFQLQVPTGEENVYRIFRCVTTVSRGRGASQEKADTWDLLATRALLDGADAADIKAARRLGPIPVA